MPKTLEKRQNLEGMAFIPPVRTQRLTDHIKNIDEGIRALSSVHNGIKDPVILYVLGRSDLYVAEHSHSIHSCIVAERIKRGGSKLSYNYYTLRGLLEEREEIRKGKYIVDEEGYIIDEA